eukprot:bmy_02953T0
MTKGTSSFGKRRNKTHTLCRRCGSKAYHLQKSTCDDEVHFPVLTFSHSLDMYVLVYVHVYVHTCEICTYVPSIATEELEYYDKQDYITDWWEKKSSFNISLSFLVSYESIKGMEKAAGIRKALSNYHHSSKLNKNKGKGEEEREKSSKRDHYSENYRISDTASHSGIRP